MSCASNSGMICRIVGNLLRLGLGVAALALAGGRAFASEAVPSKRDTLVYKDGDRVQGTLVTREQDTIVFKADRFGEVRVPAADAVVILAEKLTPPTATSAFVGAATPTVVAQGIQPAATAK